MSSSKNTLANNRIALFIPDLSYGGAQKGFIKIANELIELGYQVDMLFFGATVEFSTYLSPGVNRIQLPAKNAYQCLIPLMRYLKQIQPAALLATLDLTNIIAILAKKLSRASTPVSIYIVNSPSLQIRSKLKKGLEKIFLSIFYPLADHIIACSEGARQDLAEYISIPADQIVMQYLPTTDENLKKLAGEPLNHPWFRAGPRPVNPPVIIGIGRLVAQKNFGLLVDSFAKVVQSKDARLMLVGEGPQQEMIENKVKRYGLEDCVELTGYLLNPYPYLKRAAALAIPSDYDGLSMILVEAMYLGTPLICTDCVSGPREALDHGKYGHLTPVGDADALAAGLFDILQGHGRRADAAWLDQFTVKHGTPQLLAKIGLSST